MIVKSRSDFHWVLHILEREPLMVVDLETTGLYPFNGDKIIGVAIATPCAEFYFPFEHNSGNIQGRNVWHLRDVLTKPNTLYVGHNYKFDLKFLSKAGIPLPEKICDTMLGAKLHNENEPAGLKQWADKYIGPDSSAEQAEIIDALAELGYKGKKAMGHLAELSPDLVGKYAMQDVRLTLQVFNILRRRLGRYGLIKLWKEYNQYLLALTRMELRGIKVDTYRCAVLSKEFDEQAAVLLEFLKHRVKRDDFNPRSPKQICEFLNLESSKKSVMDDLAEKRGPRADFARQLLEYRKLAKARGTYFEPYKRWVGDDGAIHCNLYLGGTKTGRLSCNDPNLQQVPRDANTVKTVFVARPGKVFIEADYEQAELRLAADLANDTRMIGTFNQDLDPHLITALEVNNGQAIQTTKMLLVQCGLPPNGTGAEILCRLFESRPKGTGTDSVLSLVSSYWKDKESRYRSESSEGENGKTKSFVRQWYGGVQKIPEDFLRTLREYELLTRSPQRLQQVEQRPIEHRNAVRILSLCGTSKTQELSSEWKEYRQAAKTTNFGVIYSIGVNGLAAQLKKPRNDARNYLLGFHETYPAFKQAAKAAEKQAKEDGYVRIWTGRLRRFPDPEDAYKAWNSKIQGGVAELVRRAITRIDRERGNTLYDQGLQMVLTVHDSILFEVPETLAESYIPYIIDAMTADNVHLRVPQAVELKVGKNYGSLAKVDNVTKGVAA